MNVHFLNLEYIITAIVDFVRSTDWIHVLNIFFVVVRWFHIPALIIAGFLGWVIYHSKKELGKIVEKDKLVLPHGDAEVKPNTKLNEKWQRVVSHVNSPNPNDWRMAIVEADIMLDEILKSAGYQGDSLGERLKSVDVGDMQNLDAAWEAHKVRNLVAHQGSNYQLSERDAKRVIGLYKKVFEEYYYI
jgi:hypothetical protein